MKILLVFAAAMTFISLACAPKQQSPDDLKERTAEATATLKQDAKAVAEGVREGWSRDKPLDINKATRDQLMSLPGINGDRADRIIGARPYDSAQDFLNRRIITETEYSRIKDLVTAKR